jgi:Family of unknown function (DUF6594)
MATQRVTTRPSSDRRLVGYPKLARQMASTTSLRIFRRFENLSIFNLLSLQAELVDLEGQLKESWEVEAAMDENKTCSKNFKSLREMMDAEDQDSNGETNGQPNEQPKKEQNQWRLVVRIRDVLKEYSTVILFQMKITWKLTTQDETLLQVVEVSKLSTPDTQSFKLLKEWLEMKTGGDHFLPEDSYEVQTWCPEGAKEDDKTDFVLLVVPDGENDFFQRWISSTPLESFTKHVVKQMGGTPPSKAHPQPDEESGIINYKDSIFDRISTFVALIVSLTFLMGAICSLYFNKNTLQRIGIMAGFTAAFGVALKIFTTAKRTEIFTSTAA